MFSMPLAVRSPTATATASSSSSSNGGSRARPEPVAAAGVRWTEMERGGHFAAMEVPELMVRELREAFLL